MRTKKKTGIPSGGYFLLLAKYVKSARAIQLLIDTFPYEEIPWKWKYFTNSIFI
jgi:hypothetical protein